MAAELEPVKGGNTHVAAVALTVGLWTAQYASLTARGLLNKAPFLADLSFWRVFTCALGAVICFAMGWIMSRFRERKVGFRILLMLGLTIPASLLWSWVNLEILMNARVNMNSPYWSPTDLLINAVFMAWVFGAWGAGWIALQASAALAEREVQLARASALVTDTQNKMLRYQLNPHFMFNTLSALSVLILEGRNKAAEAIVVNLARFLRMSLERSPQDRISLTEELAIQDQYLAIERLRFEDRLAVEVDVTGHAGTCLVPSLILHPVIENAIKYGVAGTDEKVTVHIEAQEQDGELTLKVSDDGVVGDASTTPAAKLGVGLANIRDRLSLLYGLRASLTAGVRPGGGYEAVIRMPAERA